MCFRQEHHLGVVAPLNIQKRTNCRAITQTLTVRGQNPHCSRTGSSWEPADPSEEELAPSFFERLHSFSVVPIVFCGKTSTSRKMDINTGSRGPFVPEIKPVQKIWDKSPPSLVPVPYKPVLKGPPRWLPGECRARDLWYRFVTRTGTKGIQGLGF
jgi:hypothetical protein